MLVREPYFQTRATERMKTVDQSQRLKKNFCTYEANQLTLEIEEASICAVGSSRHFERSTLARNISTLPY
jgi:hypothetical protein